MTALKSSAPELERFLARLLDYGTWIACAVIAMGLVEAFARPNARGMFIVALGVGLIIALPIVRVMSMLAYFVKIGDRRFSVVAGIVLIIIFAGILIGL
jgi:uncharacterized membrane protein